MNMLSRYLWNIRRIDKIGFRNNLNMFLNTMERKLGKTTLLSYPITLDIVPTKLCNLNCIFCIQYATDVQQMTVENFKIIAQKLFPYASFVYFCSGGEPFLNKNFIEFLSLCRESHVMINITSNGTLLSEDIGKKLVENGRIMSLNFSFDGAKKETVESIRRGMDYQKVVDAMRTMVMLRHNKKFPLLNIRCAVMRRNIEELPELVLRARTWGIDRVIVNYLNVANAIDVKESLFYYPELTGRVFNEVLNIARKEKIHVELPDLIGIPQKIRFCEYPWRFIKIDPDGSVRFCYKAWGNPIGNIFKEESLFTMWNNAHFQLLRKTLNSERPYFKYCSICSVRKGMNAESSHCQFLREDLYEFDNEYEKLYGIKVPLSIRSQPCNERNARQ